LLDILAKVILKLLVIEKSGMAIRNKKSLAMDARLVYF